MDISMFFEFPGVLITIGAVLLVLSIVLLIIAFKTSNEPKVGQESNESITEEGENKTSDIKEIEDDEAKEETKEELKSTGIMDAIENSSDKENKESSPKEEKETENETEKEADEEGFDLNKVFETSEDDNPNDLDIPSEEIKEEDEVELL